MNLGVGSFPVAALLPPPPNLKIVPEPLHLNALKMPETFKRFIFQVLCHGGRDVPEGGSGCASKGVRRISLWGGKLPGTPKNGKLLDLAHYSSKGPK